MAEYIKREAAIAYIREQSEECQKAFEELGGESGIYADAYNDLAEDFYSIPAADVAPVVRCEGCAFSRLDGWVCGGTALMPQHRTFPNSFCSDGERKDGGRPRGREFPAM